MRFPVTRTAHPTDRRTTLAEITDAGRIAAKQATEALNDLDFGTEPLRKSELKELSKILGRLRLHAGDYTLRG